MNWDGALTWIHVIEGTSKYDTKVQTRIYLFYLLEYLGSDFKQVASE